MGHRHQYRLHPSWGGKFKVAHYPKFTKLTFSYSLLDAHGITVSEMRCLLRGLGGEEARSAVSSRLGEERGSEAKGIP